MDSLKKTPGCTLDVNRPSNTGKARALLAIIWLLVAVGHKILICTPTITAVGHDANQITKSTPKGSVDKKKILRLKIQSIEQSRAIHALLNDPSIDPSPLGNKSWNPSILGRTLGSCELTRSS